MLAGEPIERRLYRLDRVSGPRSRTPHHDDRKAEIASGQDLRLGRSAAARFADEHIDRMTFEPEALLDQGEGPPSDPTHDRSRSRHIVDLDPAVERVPAPRRA